MESVMLLRKREREDLTYCSRDFDRLIERMQADIRDIEDAAERGMVRRAQLDALMPKVRRARVPGVGQTSVRCRTSIKQPPGRFAFYQGDF